MSNGSGCTVVRGPHFPTLKPALFPWAQGHALVPAFGTKAPRQAEARGVALEEGAQLGQEIDWD